MNIRGTVVVRFLDLGWNWDEA